MDFMAKKAIASLDQSERRITFADMPDVSRDVWADRHTLAERIARRAKVEKLSVPL